jgi:hypothetical protein
MKASRTIPSLFIGTCFAGCVALIAHNSTAPDLPLIDQLDEAVQHRFQDPAPLSLGMSRAVNPLSFGIHYTPTMTSQRDFNPENSAERKVLADLEERKTQVGFYLFGTAVVSSEAASLNYRALKGPAAMTRNTPRPAWYPGLVKNAAPPPGSLPDWNAIYPLARKAMRSFEDGGKGFETTFDTWNIAARPVIASQERCLMCHTGEIPGTSHAAKLNQAIGGVLYAFRRAQNSRAQN